jgi:hypothetical protein
MYLNRTHPVVEGLASYIMTTALDPVLPSPARRCGAIRTRAVECRTTVLLVRYRFHLLVQHTSREQQLLAEESDLLGFEGAPSDPKWLDPGLAESLLTCKPSANLAPEAARNFVSQVIQNLAELSDHLDERAKTRAGVLLETHRRVRLGAGVTGVRFSVEPKLPPDVLGVYVYLPDSKLVK